MLREPHRMFEPNRLKTRSYYTVARVVPPDGSALRHVVHTYRELALVVRVADAGGALIDVRDLLQDLGGALPVGRRCVVAFDADRIPVVRGVDAHATADHPVDVHAHRGSGVTERTAHRVVRIHVGGTLVGVRHRRDDLEVGCGTTTFDLRGLGSVRWAADLEAVPYLHIG